MYKEVGILFKKEHKAPTGDLKLPLGRWKLKAKRKKMMPKMEIDEVDEIPEAEEIDTTITDADKSADNSLF